MTLYVESFNYIYPKFGIPVISYGVFVSTGDEMLMDNDNTFLDEAINAPNAPSKEPGADTVKDGLPVDEFGLPQMTSWAHLVQG